MTFRQVLLMLGLTVLGVFLLSLVWEFALEDLINPFLLDHHESEPLEERWEYVITSTVFVSIALIFPALISQSF